MIQRKFLVVNGPNLGHLGARQPEIYGHLGMERLPELIREIMGSRAQELSLDFFHGNGEGQIIDRLELARDEGVHGVVLNAGAYTHTSLAIADCLAWIGIPCVEVHLSNVLSRDPVRHNSVIGRHCIGVISGFGLLSYALAVQALWNTVQD
ncbi:MAG: type II 3-dehydroquinate dehydratase [Desulfovibrionales bacterium]